VSAVAVGSCHPHSLLVQAGLPRADCRCAVANLYKGNGFSAAIRHRHRAISCSAGRSSDGSRQLDWLLDFADEEVRRFAKVYTQTIAAPVVTTLLFYAVFSLSMVAQPVTRRGWWTVYPSSISWRRG